MDSRRRGTAAPCSCANCDSDSLRNIPAHTRGLRTEATRYRLLRMRVPVRGQRRKPDRSKSGVHAKKSTTGLSDRFSFDAGEAVARVAECVDRAGRRKAQWAEREGGVKLEKSTDLNRVQTQRGQQRHTSEAAASTTIVQNPPSTRSLVTPSRASCTDVDSKQCSIMGVEWLRHHCLQ